MIAAVPCSERGAGVAAARGPSFCGPSGPGILPADIAANVSTIRAGSSAPPFPFAARPDSLLSAGRRGPLVATPRDMRLPDCMPLWPGAFYESSPQSCKHKSRTFARAWRAPWPSPPSPERPDVRRPSLEGQLQVVDLAKLVVHLEQG